MAILIDTSVLAAYAFKRDKNHDRAVKFIEQIADKSSCIVAAPVLSELFYFVTVRMSYAHAVRVFVTTRLAFPIEVLNDHEGHAPNA